MTNLHSLRSREQRTAWLLLTPALLLLLCNCPGRNVRNIPMREERW
ncbi:MAG: hypothetical protein V7K21_06480 [Nostoc sp.]